MSEFDELAQQNNGCYNRLFRRVVKILLFLGLIAVGLLAALIIVMCSQSGSKYYASTTTGSVVPIDALNSPIVTQKFIEQWAQTVVRSVYSLNFLSYQKQLDNAEGYFTTAGWNSFAESLKSSGYLDTIKDSKLDVSTVVNGPVVIVNQYVKNNFFTWDVQVPLLVLYTSANTEMKRQIYVELTIQRVPEVDIARGIAVTNFVARGSINEK